MRRLVDITNGIKEVGDVQCQVLVLIENQIRKARHIVLRGGCKDLGVF